jgi:hypothetical protein
MLITNIGQEQLKSMRRRGQFAAAFSCSTALATMRYTAADAVALLLSAELARTYGAKPAAQLVLMLGGAVLRAISEAESSSADAVVGIADLTRDSDGRRAHLACGAAAVGAEGFATERVVACNISRLVRRVRVEAERAGIDLSAPFMPTPDSAEFSAILASYAELDLVVEAGARRKRLADARRAGELARAVAMGGRVATARKVSAAQAA